MALNLPPINITKYPRLVQRIDLNAQVLALPYPLFHHVKPPKSVLTPCPISKLLATACSVSSVDTLSGDSYNTLRLLVLTTVKHSLLVNRN